MPLKFSLQCGICENFDDTQLKFSSQCGKCAKFDNAPLKSHSCYLQGVGHKVIIVLEGMVVDPHRFNADPYADPAFSLIALLDPD